MNERTNKKEKKRKERKKKGGKEGIKGDRERWEHSHWRKEPEVLSFSEQVIEKNRKLNSFDDVWMTGARFTACGL